MIANMVSALPTEDRVVPAQSRRNAADSRSGVMSASSRCLPGTVVASSRCRQTGAVACGKARPDARSLYHHLYKCCYNLRMTGTAPDPTEHSRWRPLRLLQTAMDADIARIYAEAQIGGLKPSYVMELLRLRARGPMTITE